MRSPFIGVVLLSIGAQELPWYRTLRAAALDPGSVANEMVHTVGPAFAVADWLPAGTCTRS
ncbi:hypothetical protein EDF46_1435 [Frondihabitans sp. PhB188]|uniref:hypothetical protein n=1 Tax=Frondihabitans sp. PhB188 TaxID=2485200 RepID=UPI000F9609C3|nr:hypothetical protein [Frondihabitans sp. PhB188]ROQ39802.1 hypothetical protein EDF46_1435 [Frondihabitans sp. PhB188]